MKNIQLNTRIIVITAIILLAAFSRLIPHLPNFTPIGAIALFGGACFINKKLALLIPFLAMLLSDLLIGFHGTMVAVYLSFIAIVGIGMLLKNRVKPLSVLFAALGSSILFFIVTNFAVWMEGANYTFDLVGLFTCYIAAIPFFHYTLIGDLLFTGILFYFHYMKFYRIGNIQKPKNSLVP